MLPFCGYNMADYFSHWLELGERLEPMNLPKIFQVNWFRKSKDGEFLWPGFSENARVLEWIIRRIENEAAGVDSPIGILPEIAEINLGGLDITESQLTELFDVDPKAWLHEVRLTEQFFDRFGEKLPNQLRGELIELEARLLEWHPVRI
jgi:phosphoenolpyruvate carboxykinase (GTP)